MPKSSTPALLLTIVSSFVPLRRTAAMRFSGMPQRPKPPMRIVAPSRRFSMATSGEAMRLSTSAPECRKSLTQFERRGYTPVNFGSLEMVEATGVTKSAKTFRVEVWKALISNALQRWRFRRNRFIPNIANGKLRRFGLE